MINRLILFLLGVIFLNTSCNNRDLEKKLVGRYYYRDEGGEMKQILAYTGSSHNEIYGKVLSYDYDNEFIIVSQEPSSEDYIGMLSFYLRDDAVKYSKNDKDALRKSEKEADSLMKNNKYYQSIFRNDTNYWIIQIANDSLIGPFTRSEFEKTRKEMEIPDKLKLD